MQLNFEIANETFMAYEKPMFIAEISANHNKSIENTIKLIDEAHKAGADGIKLQTFTPETITFNSTGEKYRVSGNAWEGNTLHELYEKAYMPWDDQEKIINYCRRKGIICFSTPFDFSAVDFLIDADVPAFKIASSELVDLPLIKAAARHNKPLIISTGMGNRDEIQQAVDAVRSINPKLQICLLKCTAEYPANGEDANLGVLKSDFTKFGCAIGLSDHTIGSVVPIVAAINGAVIFEKHITLSRGLGGIDSHFSSEPHEFASMISDVKMALAANKNKGIDFITPGEANSRKYRKSLICVKKIRPHEVLTAENIAILRPAIGLSPKHYEKVLGKSAKRQIQPGDPITWDDLNLD